MMAITFDGLYHFKILTNGKTVDTQEYIAFLKDVNHAFNSTDLAASRKSIPWELMCLQHDNARPHISNVS